MSFKVSVPGSVMLLGEHAVLEGSKAVVCAVNHRLSLTLSPRPDQKISVHSLLGECETDIIHLQFPSYLRFVQAVCARFKGKFHQGFDLIIASQFSDKVGLGSSAAVTVGMIALLQKWLENIWNLQKIYEAGFATILNVQGIGSGADVAASTFGGVLAYCPKPFYVKKIAIAMPIHLIYVGYKTPTVEVIWKVKHHFEKQPAALQKIYDNIASCTKHGIEMIRHQSWRSLGKVFSEHQQCQRQLGVSDQTIDSLIARINQQSHIYGAKISGSGLGDCVVVLGDGSLCESEENMKQIDVQVSENGVMDESN